MCSFLLSFVFSHSYIFFFNDTATTEIYTLSLHDALPILLITCRTPLPSWHGPAGAPSAPDAPVTTRALAARSEEHTSELQSRRDLVCRLLLEKKKKKNTQDSLSPT